MSGEAGRSDDEIRADLALRRLARAVAAEAQLAQLRAELAAAQAKISEYETAARAAASRRTA